MLIKPVFAHGCFQLQAKDRKVFALNSELTQLSGEIKVKDSENSNSQQSQRLLEEKLRVQAREVCIHCSLLVP